MTFNIKKISAIVLFSCLATTASANIQMLGGENEISQSIADHFQQPTQVYVGDLTPKDLLYINVGTASEDQIKKAKSHVLSGDTVVIDLSMIASDEEKIERSRSIAGLGMSAPILVMGTHQGDDFINAIVSDVVDENNHPINNAEAELASIKQSLVHSLTSLGFGE